MIEYITLAIIVLQMGILAWVMSQHKKERQDLYNRIMANDFKDYRLSQKPIKSKGGGNIVAAGLKKYLEEQEKLAGG